MPGTKTDAYDLVGFLNAFSEGSIDGAIDGSLLANQVLLESTMSFPARIAAVKARAETAGTGAGNTVLDILINGTTIWRTAGNRPTLLATSTGEFANTQPTNTTLQSDDRLQVKVISISTTGHRNVSLQIALKNSGRMIGSGIDRKDISKGFIR